MYENGMSAAMLAQYFAVSLGEIYRVLREHSVQLHKRK
jgi:Mor family transcriptional regulator